MTYAMVVRVKTYIIESSTQMTENTYKICPNCDYFCHANESDIYCPLCGEKLLDACPHCKARIILPYASFCKICGKRYPGKTNK
ncbi:MAG: zinc ribbon domain-containing protein [Candidatus Marinimicrobia bacterium]|nr:zinc ribbon domain-containing protein [Candidatus Neomarinimicrobiota bacterium]